LLIQLLVLNEQGAFRKIEAAQAENGTAKSKDELLSYGRVLGPEVLAKREAFAAVGYSLE
jgi:hypothetical protein